MTDFEVMKRALELMDVQILFIETFGDGTKGIYTDKETYFFCEDGSFEYTVKD